ncbi:hypothetical protein INR49_014609 [Caranx melampygus]|nr:hypothetical protein INR49_014609 [Caranx melampygus]
MVLPGSQTFDDIRRQIENMKQQMEKSEHIANTELQRLDRATETLTVQQSQLAQQKIQKTNELNNLNTHLSSLQSTLRSYYQALETARRNLRSAENTLSDMREKRDKAERLRDAGIGVMFIPVAGWIAGAIMVGVGQSDMNRYSDAADTARREVAYSESQDKMRRAVTHLGLLSGVGSVAELQTRRLILLEPVMKLLEQRSSIQLSAGQHVELRRLAQALIVPLKSGLSSFNTVSGILLSIKADMVLPGCQTFDDVRRHILNTKQQMEESEHRAKAELQQVDRATETLTAEQTLETERGNLQTAENTLSDMRAKRDEAQRIRDIGIGAVMVGVGQVDMDRASEAADTARQEVANCESQVNSYSNQVQHYNSLIGQAQCDITAADNKIHETDAKLRDMSVKRGVVADIQDKMRRAVTHLALLSGVGSVVELQTRRLILLEPVMKVLEQMTSILGQISGNELLHSEGILSLMEDMKMNHRNLKELADTNKSTDMITYDYKPLSIFAWT